MPASARGEPTPIPVSSFEEELLRVNSELGVPVPAYAGRSLANLPASWWSAVGAAEGVGPPLPPLEAGLDPFAGRRAEGPIVVFLLDGLGWRALEGAVEAELPGAAAHWMGHARPVTSVFPTTTAVVLTSLTSGAAPSQHGVVGHRVYLPRFGTVVEMLRMSPVGVAPSETLVGPEWGPSMISGVPTVFRRGLGADALSRDRFEGTGFTRLIYDGATYVPYATGSDLALSLVDVLSGPKPPPLVLVYRDDLDLVQHLRGYRSELVKLEVERAQAILSFAARHLPESLARRIRVLITGDHGQVPLSAEHQLVVDREPELLDLLIRPPSGDRRATFFAAKPGRRVALRDWLAGRLPRGGHLIEMPTAVEAGLFGPPPRHPELAERLGDFLVLVPSPGGVSYTPPGGRQRGHRMLAAHGGLEPEELLVPLVSMSLHELGAPETLASLRPGALSPVG